MTSPPDGVAVAAVERALRPIDAALSAQEVYEALAAVVRDVTDARAVATLTLNSGTVHVAAFAGALGVERGQALSWSRPLVDLLSSRSAAVGVVSSAELGLPEVWPVLALTHPVAAVAVMDAGTRAADAVVAATCRYGGLRLSQLFDAELREDQLHERGAAIKTLRRLADTDALTGVSNRSGVFAVLNSLLGRGEPVGLLYLDLDGFKEVNDTYGHAAGDSVLAAVAQRLRRVVRAPDLVGRIGGDEFVLVVRGGDERALGRLVRRVNEVLRAPVTVKDLSIPVAASCGIAVASHGGSAADLLAVADSRMYEHKNDPEPANQRVIDLDARR